MDLGAYRRVLARPGVGRLVAIMVVARIPLAATALVLTLHVALGPAQGGLAMGYAAAGTALAAVAVGGALGSPMVGRAIDRLGLRPVLATTTVVSTLFWCVAPVLPFAALLPAAAVAGLFGVPVFSLLRQAMATMLPEQERKAGFSLDTMSAEISFSAGPLVAVLLVTRFGSTIAMITLGATIAAVGVALMLVNPPVRGSVDEPDRAPDSRVAVRVWLSGQVAAILLATAGSTLIFSGTDVAITASMRSFHAVALVGVVISVWGLGSVVGGFVYGTSTRRWDPVVLLAVVGALIMPVSLATSWGVLAALMIPAALCCGPLVSASADQVVGRTQAAVRGEVIGSHSSALTVGNALGTPMAGVIIDSTSPRIGFLRMGAVGLTLALVGLGARAVHHRRPRPAD